MAVSDVKDDGKDPRYEQHQVRRALILGFAACLGLAGAATLSWAGWLTALDFVWPAAPAWIPWTIHLGAGSVAALAVFSVHEIMEDHAYCGSNRWQYECAVPRLVEVVLIGLGMIILLPFSIFVCAIGVLLKGMTFCEEAWQEHRRRRTSRRSSSPAASP